MQDGRAGIESIGRTESSMVRSGDLKKADLRAVDQLAVAYVRILKHVQSMQTFDRQSAEYAVLDSDVETRLVKRLGWPGRVLWPLRLLFYPIRGWWRSFMLRQVISFYVSTHINNSATKLSRALIFERLNNIQTSDPQAESLERSIAIVEGLKTITTGWVVLLVILRFVPLVGLLFSMGIVTVSFTLDNAPELGRQLRVFLALVIFVVHPIVVQFGFRWKRALFAGGGGDGSDDPAGLPRTNVYEIEQQVYERLGVKRASEFPVDLFLAPGIYFLFNLIVDAALQPVDLGDLEPAVPAGTAEALGGFISLAIFSAFFVVALIRLVLRYKLRRASGFF